MSKSAIYVVNSASQAVVEDGTINPGTVIRKFGQNINLAGTGIQIAGPGYYDLETSITMAPTAEGQVTVTACLDNVAIPGAVATETAAAAGDYVNLSFHALVRQGCYCCDGLNTITFVLSDGGATITNISTIVEKI